MPDSPVAERSRLARLLDRVAIDVGPLRRHRDFRLLFVAQTASYFGRMVAQVAVPYQIYELTRSTLAVGLVELLAFFPLAGLGLVGGAFADAHDRRLIVILSEVGFGCAAVLLLLNSLLPHPFLAAIYALEVAAAALFAVQRPSLDALLPRLVEREELTAAAALATLRGTVPMIVGPAVGGLLIAAGGLPAAYGLYVLTFLLALVPLIAMRAVPPPTGAAAVNVRAIADGVRYAASRPDLLGTYLVDVIAMFFGMPLALFPAVADRLGGPAVLGLLTLAPAVGSLLVNVSSGWTRHVHRHGRAIVIAASMWGVAITCFGLVPTLPLVLLCLAVAGGADTVSGIFRTTIWNTTIPDSLRGRLAGVELISYTSGPALGNFEAGAVASVWGVRVSIVSGGLLCVVGAAACAVFLRGFWAYDDRT